MSFTVKLISCCARCGKDHPDVTFEPFKRPHGEWTHWAACPTNGQPILMRITADETHEEAPSAGVSLKDPASQAMQQRMEERFAAGRSAVGAQPKPEPADHVELPTGAKRSNAYPPGKVFPARYDLLFRNATALRRLAETWGEGEAKYGQNNWSKGFPESVDVSHALEHIRLYLAGDLADDHLSHAVWNLMHLMWVQDNKPELLDLTKIPQKI